MVPVVKQLCPESKYGIKCTYTRTPQNIVVHNTGNCAPADNEVAYMLRNNYEVSFHAAVDDKKIIEAIPFGRNAWASGDGTGRGNMYGIHIEICYSNYVPANTSLSESEVYARFAVAEHNAAEYIARLLKNYGWGLDKVTKHQDYDGKYCPHRTLALGWQRFLNMVKTELDKLNQPEKEEPEMTKAEIEAMAKTAAKAEVERLNPTYNTLDDVPSYWRDDIKELVGQGIIKGTGGEKLGLTRSECKAAVIVKRAMEKE